MRLLPKQAVVIVAVAIFGVGIAHAEFLTKVEGVTSDAKLLEEFALGNTPCRIEEFTKHSSALSTYLAEAGLNIVADKDAKCLIVYDGYVTMYRTGTPDPLPLVEYDLLAHTTGMPYAAPPLLSATNASGDMDKAVNIMGLRDGWAKESDIGGIAIGLQQFGGIPGAIAALVGTVSNAATRWLGATSTRHIRCRHHAGGHACPLFAFDRLRRIACTTY